MRDDKWADTHCHVCGNKFVGHRAPLKTWAKEEDKYVKVKVCNQCVVDGRVRLQ
jgi:hypothetical protein